MEMGKEWNPLYSHSHLKHQASPKQTPLVPCSSKKYWFEGAASIIKAIIILSYYIIKNDFTSNKGFNRGILPS